MKKVFKIICVVILCILLFTIVIYAHSGRTDSSGGHYNHSTGEYHYHHGESAHDHYDIDGDGTIDCPRSFNYIKAFITNVNGNDILLLLAAVGGTLLIGVFLVSVLGIVFACLKGRGKEISNKTENCVYIIVLIVCYLYLCLCFGVIKALVGIIALLLVSAINVFIVEILLMAIFSAISIDVQSCKKFFLILGIVLFLISIILTFVL